MAPVKPLLKSAKAPGYGRLSSLLAGERPLFHMSQNPAGLTQSGRALSSAGAHERGLLTNVEGGFGRLRNEVSGAPISKDGVVDAAELVKNRHYNTPALSLSMMSMPGAVGDAELARAVKATPGPSKSWNHIHMSESPDTSYGSVGLLTRPGEISGKLRKLKSGVGDEIVAEGQPLRDESNLISGIRLPEASGSLVYDPHLVPREEAKRLKGQGAIPLNRRSLSRLKALQRSAPEIEAEEFPRFTRSKLRDVAKTDEFRGLNQAAKQKFTKTSASLGRWKIPQTRSGRRSISVTKLLKRESEGKLFKKHAADKIPGGLADAKVFKDFPRRALKKGVKVEREHTNRDLIAREIAMDHLTEDEDYYDKLEKVEKRAFKLEGETTFQGLDVAIENDKGSVRKGTNADGSKWETKFHTPYGYLRGTKGADGEEIDAYAGPERDSPTAYVVHQKKDDGSHDEDTVMLGYDSKASAKADILRHYDNPKYVGSIDAVPMAKLHKIVDSGKKMDKISHAMDTLGELSRSWELPSSEDEENTSVPESIVDQGTPFGISLSQIGARDIDEPTKTSSARFNAVVEEAFIEELQKIAAANGGILPWVGDVGDFQAFVSGHLEKNAFSGGIRGAVGGVRQFAQNAIGKLRPAAPTGMAGEVASFRKGTGFFSTGMGKDLAAGGKALSHNPQAAGRAAGLGAKDLGALQQMRPTSAGRRITGEVAHGAGHHIAHSHPLQLALNPIGTGMGGAIEGAARGVGKEMAGSARRGVQTAGRLMQQHAPKIGLGGELVAGGFLHTPGLASALGGALAPGAHGVAQHALGEGAQRLGKAFPRAMGLAGRVASHA